ncbi:hypothetical protein HMI54_000654 [Coelomomyces lativittatus]|nr:hypothetical protein HMI56_000361 [Coelomomyces lativittatus]KAJ1511614.1 hypothetical protein HMI54_000654 [Coelomomyces lativittatus]KAJ1517584.1 hypothetical protein HMI55_006620 [Coelomomyces lativittatus]
MAGPYQRRKIKNPSLKTNTNSKKRKKSIKGMLPEDPILRKKWNPKWSIAKNYTNLGLCHTLNNVNPKKKVSVLKPFLLTETGKTVPLDDFSASFHQGMVVKPAKVEKNEKGEVVSYSILESEMGLPTTTTTTPTSCSVSDMEQGKLLKCKPMVIPRSKPPPLPCKRMLGWLDQLRMKHGEDYHAMFMDKQLNVYQHTEAQLRAKILKCKKLLEA